AGRIVRHANLQCVVEASSFRSYRDAGIGRGGSYIWHIPVPKVFSLTDGMSTKRLAVRCPEMSLLHARSTIRTSIRGARSRGTPDRGGHPRRRPAQAPHP